MIMTIMSEKYANEIVTCKYEVEYSIYDYYDWDVALRKNTSLAVESIRKDEFVAFINSDNLVGFGRIQIADGKVVLGIGIEPNLCGNGFGGEALKLLIAESKNRYPQTVITLEVRSFNKRAIGLYIKFGFEVIDTYFKETPIGNGEFLRMQLIPNINKSVE